MLTNKDHIRQIVEKAKRNGTIKAPSERDQIVSMVESVNPSMYPLVKEFFSSLLADANVQRSVPQDVDDRIRKWMKVDFEILNRTFDVELNPEAPVHVCHVMLQHRIKRMSPDDLRDVPEMVWEIVKAIEKIALGRPQPQPKEKPQELIPARRAVASPTRQVAFSIERDDINQFRAMTIGCGTASVWTRRHEGVLRSLQVSGVTIDLEAKDGKGGHLMIRGNDLRNFSSAAIQLVLDNVFNKA